MGPWLTLVSLHSLSVGDGYAWHICSWVTGVLPGVVPDRQTQGSSVLPSSSHPPWKDFEEQLVGLWVLLQTVFIWMNWKWQLGGEDKIVPLDFPAPKCPLVQGPVKEEVRRVQGLLPSLHIAHFLATRCHKVLPGRLSNSSSRRCAPPTPVRPAHASFYKNIRGTITRGIVGMHISLWNITMTPVFTGREAKPNQRSSVYFIHTLPPIPLLRVPLIAQNNILFKEKKSFF